VPEVIRPRGGSYFRTFVAPDAIRILDHIPDRLRQKRFVTQPGDSPKCSCVQPRMDSISRSAAEEKMYRRMEITSPCDVSPNRRRGARSGR
jgi:hypothetical protein